MTRTPQSPRLRSRIAIASLAAFVLAACNGGGLSKGAIEKAIEASFEDGNVCWATKDIAATTFPIRVGFDPLAKGSNAILEGLVRSEVIQVSQEEVFNGRRGVAFGQQVLNIELTDAGRAADVWDKERGFCVGRKEVAEVLQWSEPGENESMQVSQVTYRWHIVDHPSWLDKAAFASIDGFTEPVEGMAVLRKMNDGWSVVQ